MSAFPITANGPTHFKGHFPHESITTVVDASRYFSENPQNHLNPFTQEEFFKTPFLDIYYNGPTRTFEFTRLTPTNPNLTLNIFPSNVQDEIPGSARAPIISFFTRLDHTTNGVSSPLISTYSLFLDHVNDIINRSLKKALFGERTANVPSEIRGIRANRLMITLSPDIRYMPLDQSNTCPFMVNTEPYSFDQEHRFRATQQQAIEVIGQIPGLSQREAETLRIVNLAQNMFNQYPEPHSVNLPPIMCTQRFYALTSTS